MIRPQQQRVLSIEPMAGQRERLHLGCGCTIERALRAVKPKRAICPNHDRRPDE